MIMMGLHLSGERFESSSAGGSFDSEIKPALKAAAAAPGDNLAEVIPFRRLYLHSLVRTAEGAKMSKTKGTGVDPLQLTEQYGTDAMRYMLASMAAPGTDIILSEDRILGARAFANKIWNAARFLFFNLEKIEAQGVTLEELAAPEIRAKAPYRRKRRRRSVASLDILAPLRRRRRSEQSARRFPLPRSLPHDLSIFLGRFLRLVHRVGQTAAGRSPTAKSQSPHGAIFSPRSKPRCAFCIRLCRS